VTDASSQYKKLYAVYGIDRRSYEKKGQGRSDVMLLVKLDTKAKTMDIVSIERDSRVDIPNHGLTKINAAYAYGKAPLANKVLEKLFDVKLDNYVSLDFYGFIDIINSLGGVDVNSKKEYVWDDADFGKKYIIKKGQQTLDGENALTYARFRHDNDGVSGRQERQMEIVSSVLQKIININNILSLPKEISIIKKNIETDANTKDIMKMAFDIVDFKDYKINTHAVEVDGKMINGGWYGIINEKSLKECSDILKK